MRIDNLKTGVASGAGPSAVLNPAFQTVARTCGFAVDPCRGATGSDKGKVERRVRAERSVFADLLRCDWRSLDCLQGALDARAAQVHDRRRCPITGTTIAEAHRAERALLQAVPSVQEPFDCVVARRVTRDCLVSFEGRRYSVPFASVGRVVEVRGTAQHVVIVADGHELARHARHTAARLVLVATHYEGESTATVRAPTPLGRRAQLQLADVTSVAGLPAAAAVARPLDVYIALVAEACRGALSPRRPPS